MNSNIKEFQNHSVEKKTLLTALNENFTQLINLENIYSRKAEPLGDIRSSSCGEGDVRRLCSSVIRAVDLQWKDLGSNPSAVESDFSSTERLSNS